MADNNLRPASLVGCFLIALFLVLCFVFVRAFAAPALLAWEKVPGSPDSVQCLHFVGPTLYAGTVQGGVFSYDGTTWRAANAGFPSIPVWVGNMFTTSRGTLLASVRTTGNRFSSVYRLSGGQWQIVSPTIQAEYAEFFCADKTGNVLMSDTQSVYRSTDDGQSFQPFSTIPGVAGLQSSCFSIGASSDGTIYCYSHDSGAWASADSGAHWNWLDGRNGTTTYAYVWPWGNSTSIQTNNKNEMVMGSGFGGVYVHKGPLGGNESSTLSGATYTSPNMINTGILESTQMAGSHSIIKLSDGSLISHFERVYTSADGYQWALNDAGLPAGLVTVGQNVQSFHTGDVAQAPDGRIYVGFWNAGVGVYRTTTGQPAPSPTPSPTPSAQATISGSANFDSFQFELLDSNRQRVSSSAQTDKYSFTVPAGSYIVRPLIPSAEYGANPSEIQVTAAAGMVLLPAFTIGNPHYMCGGQPCPPLVVGGPGPSPSPTPSPIPSPSPSPSAGFTLNCATEGGKIVCRQP